jgi:Short C-terminal domain
MPRLIRGVVRTAAVAGTATAVSNRVSRRQANKWAAQDAPAEPAYAPPPQAAAPSPDPVERLQELAKLREQGALTDAEFAAAKAKVIG